MNIYIDLFPMLNLQIIDTKTLTSLRLSFYKSELIKNAAETLENSESEQKPPFPPDFHQIQIQRT